jgi:hypothetical protein
MNFHAPVKNSLFIIQAFNDSLSWSVCYSRHQQAVQMLMARADQQINQSQLN